MMIVEEVIYRRYLSEDYFKEVNVAKLRWPSEGS